MRTYGTLTWKQGKWIADVEPHVSMRMKRVFGRLGRRQQGKLRIKDTREVCRDLEWFIQRYPLEVSCRDYLERRSREEQESEQYFAELLSGRINPQPFDLAVPARSYQQIAADLALRSKGLLIGDDVGLGKTASSIAALTDPRTRPALVVTLTHLTGQWRRELEKFAPQLRTHVIRKGTPYDVASGKTNGQLSLVEPDFPDVLIVNYNKLAGWAETLAKVIRCVVFDEVQELRRGQSSQKGIAGFHLADHAEFRIGLTATPIYNYGGEIYNVLQALKPDVLGTWDEFREEWCKASPDEGRPNKVSVKDSRALGSYLRERGLMIRRTRADVGRELPELTKVPHHVEADTKKLDEVDDSAAELARTILAQSGTCTSFDKLQASQELSWKLRQATGLAKAPYVAEFVRILCNSGERVVLYGWHREVYSLWQESLAELQPAFYTGSESTKQKDEARRRFIGGDAQVLIMSLRSGAGLDGLQGSCRTVVFGELDWSPGVHEQAVGRVHRDGQGDPVVAYFLMADHGSDPTIADALGIKRAQVEGLRDPEGLERGARQDNGDGLRRLAEHYLRQRGEKPPEPQGAAPAAAESAETAANDAQPELWTQEMAP